MLHVSGLRVPGGETLLYRGAVVGNPRDSIQGVVAAGTMFTYHPISTTPLGGDQITAVGPISHPIDVTVGSP